MANLNAHSGVDTVEIDKLKDCVTYWSTLVVQITVAVSWRLWVLV